MATYDASRGLLVKLVQQFYGKSTTRIQETRQSYYGLPFIYLEIDVVQTGNHVIVGVYKTYVLHLYVAYCNLQNNKN